MRWPWTRPLPPTHPEIAALRADMDALKRSIRDLETDWDKTYERFQRLNATMAARWRRLVDAEDQARNNPGDQREAGSSSPAPADTPTNPLALELLRGRR